MVIEDLSEEEGAACWRSSSRERGPVARADRHRHGRIQRGPCPWLAAGRALHVGHHRSAGVHFFPDGCRAPVWRDPSRVGPGADAQDGSEDRGSSSPAALSSSPSTHSFAPTARRPATHSPRRRTPPTDGSPPRPSGWGSRSSRTTESSAARRASSSRRSRPAERPNADFACSRLVPALASSAVMARVWANKKVPLCRTFRRWS